jgi:hypothetical protein
MVAELPQERPFYVRALQEHLPITSDHHAGHVLAAMLMEAQWESAWAIEVGKDPERAWTIHIRKHKNSVPIGPFEQNLPDSSRPIIPRLNRLDSPLQPLERRIEISQLSVCFLSTFR